jgi:hypothetical protein
MARTNLIRWEDCAVLAGILRLIGRFCIPTVYRYCTLLLMFCPFWVRGSGRRQEALGGGGSLASCWAHRRLVCLKGHVQ